jgi:hypothetical protein
MPVLGLTDAPNLRLPKKPVIAVGNRTAGTSLLIWHLPSLHSSSALAITRLAQAKTGLRHAHP